MITAAVFDDDYDTVDVFVTYLELKNIKVVGKGYNGKDAVEVYKEFKPDLVFCDLKMPEYDGLYALQKIREIDPESRVIIVTSDKYYGREILEKEKPTQVFYKPFEIKKILDMIVELKLA